MLRLAFGVAADGFRIGCQRYGDISLEYSELLKPKECAEKDGSPLIRNGSKCVCNDSMLVTVQSKV